MAKKCSFAFLDSIFAVFCINSGGSFSRVRKKSGQIALTINWGQNWMSERGKRKLFSLKRLQDVLDGIIQCNFWDIPVHSKWFRCSLWSIWSIDTSWSHNHSIIKKLQRWKSHFILIFQLLLSLCLSIQFSLFPARKMFMTLEPFVLSALRKPSFSHA